MYSKFQTKEKQLLKHSEDPMGKPKYVFIYHKPSAITKNRPFFLQNTLQTLLFLKFTNFGLKIWPKFQKMYINTLAISKRNLFGWEICQPHGKEIQRLDVMANLMNPMRVMKGIKVQEIC